MANLLVNILFVIIFVAIIIFVDFKYLKDDFLKRLIVNILIVLVALAFYFTYLVNL